MDRPGFLLLASLLAVVVPSSVAAQPAAVQPTPRDERVSCDRTKTSEVVVCGRSKQPYRIDPSVLAANRAAEALPPKPPVTGDVPEVGCAGPNCGGGSYVPLVGMALTGLRAAELAADGDDWREAFRTRPDEYRAYEAARAKKGGISIGIVAGSR